MKTQGCYVVGDIEIEIQSKYKKMTKNIAKTLLISRCLNLLRSITNFASHILWKT